MDCHHGNHHIHHHHHHEGLAEGLSQSHVLKLRIVLGLSFLYMVVQFFGGYFSGSLALLAESGHKLGDVSVIALALIAAWFAALPANARRTFGLGRMEVLAAFLNGLILISVAGLILSEAWERFSDGHLHEIEGGLMLGVACFGLLVNLLSVRTLHPSRDKNLNVKGAYFHVMADLVGSLGAMVSSILILLFHWLWIDLLLSSMIALMVFANAVRILGEALHVLMEASPRHIDIGALTQFLYDLPGVHSVHDLHVWTITTGKNAILTHVVVSEDAFHHRTVVYVEEKLRETYGFCHVTVQLEPPHFKEKALPF